jgi:hypothetical protein
MITVAPTGALAGVKLEIVGLIEPPHPARRNRGRTIILRYLDMDNSFFPFYTIKISSCKWLLYRKIRKH